MKALNILTSIVFLTAILAACREENINKPYGPNDGLAPGKVVPESYEKIPGGANIKFKAPADEDLLYVKAKYVLTTGRPMETRVSAYSNVLKIEGFGDTLAKEITFTAVDRMNNEGLPEKYTIIPGKPSYIKAFASVNMNTTFGGVFVTMDNPDKGNIIAELTTIDSLGNLYVAHTEYTSRENIGFAVRGFGTELREFGISVRDPWGNISDVVYAEIEPLFEKELDRNKFAELILDNDVALNLWGCALAKMWNGKIEWGTHYSEMVHSADVVEPWPAWFTFDLGVNAKLSRLKYWQRLDDQLLYTHGNIREWEVYGRTDRPNNGSWDGWTLLMTCESIKPSGLPLGIESFDEEDKTYAMAGEEFMFPNEAPVSRYIRIKVLRNWSDSHFINFQQMWLFGQDEND
ncbi:MAG: DUF4959 domain-containing protein [Prevotellaceae bacterium]|jgi:hypothetical protein|nr:DUF4959 domain-containing protein [Prevotellaceae bacterium]